MLCVLHATGRFEREVRLGVPDAEGRLDILRIHTRRMRLDPSVQLQEVSHAHHHLQLLTLCRVSCTGNRLLIISCT